MINKFMLLRLYDSFVVSGHGESYLLLLLTAGGNLSNYLSISALFFFPFILNRFKEKKKKHFFFFLNYFSQSYEGVTNVVDGRCKEKKSYSTFSLTCKSTHFVFTLLVFKVYIKRQDNDDNNNLT